MTRRKVFMKSLMVNGGARRSAASQRQLGVKSRQEEKGPGWYYVLEPVIVQSSYFVRGNKSLFSDGSRRLFYPITIRGKKILGI